MTGIGPDDGSRQQPLLTAVILTWNSANHIGRALASLAREQAGLRVEVIVVDNGSSDASLQVVEREMPCARVVQNQKNLGVARARNQGLALAHGRYILFLDSDAELASDSLHEMLRFMGTASSVGVIGPRLVYPDGRVQFSCRRFPTLQGKFLRQLPQRVRRLVPWAADEEMQSLDRTIPQPVDYVIGACQLIRREVIGTAGPLDEGMFYGPEDVDFCLRAWKAGWEVYYVPQAVVVHHEQRITRRRPGMLTLKHGVALGYYFWKHRYLWRRPAVAARVATARR